DLLEEIGDRLNELKASSTAEFIEALRRRIAEQEKATTKTQEEAWHAKEILDDLNDQLADVIAAHPSAAGSTSSASSTPSASASTTPATTASSTPFTPVPSAASTGTAPSPS